MTVECFGKLSIQNNFSLLQLFKRRNVSLPKNEDCMLESPIQDPDISSTVPIPEVYFTKMCFGLYYAS